MMQDNPEDYDDESKDEVKKLISGSYADAIKLNRASITPFTYKRIQFIINEISNFEKKIDLFLTVCKELDSIARL